MSNKCVSYKLTGLFWYASFTVQYVDDDDDEDNNNNNNNNTKNSFRKAVDQ
jgi:hypothetical protein